LPGEPREFKILPAVLSFLHTGRSQQKVKFLLNGDFNVKLFFKVCNEFRRSVSQQTFHAGVFGSIDIFLNVVNVE
jgi:hypothetical protein